MTSELSDLPLVAVVTPVYNGTPYIKATLACVQAQTYPNIIHVVLDNASTDDTPAMIADAARDGRVPILTRRNAAVLPQVQNWNAAMALTPPEARYVKFLCADDLIRADAIERLVAVAESKPNVHFVAAMDVFDDWVKPSYFGAGDAVYDGRECARRLLSGEIPWFPFPHLFFRATPERLARAFNPATVPAQDADLTMRILLEGDMGFVDAPLFYTRKHQNAVTSQIGGDGMFITPGLARLKRYGGQVLSAQELAKIHHATIRMVLRHILAWRLSGQSKAAAESLQALREFGMSPDATDYLAAVASWPLHKLRKALRMAGQQPAVRMTETDFLARQ
jgi:glycosyltransferase involved in cell wall biosynthesis